MTDTTTNTTTNNPTTAGDPGLGLAYVIIGEKDASGNVSDMVQASGILVAPDEILTAAHVAYGTNGLRSYGTVFVGYNQGNYAYSSSVDSVHVVAKADYSTDAGEQTDYALIHLSTPITGGTVYALGTNGADGTYYVSGYPAGTSGAPDTQSETLTKEAGYTNFNGAPLNQGSNNPHGSSGGSIWKYVNGTPTAFGVISAVSADGTKGFFPQLTTAMVAQINSWISQDHPVTASALPSIVGAAAGQATTSEAAVRPFSGMAVTDANQGATETVRISVSGAGGLLSGGGLVANADGSYGLSGTADQVTAALHGLSFTPGLGRPGTSSTSTLTVTDTSSAGTSATNATTTVINTDPAVAPGIAGTAHGLQAKGGATVSPFSNVFVGDATAGAVETVRIAMSGGGGTLSGAGLTANQDGSYGLSGTADQVTAALRGLGFTPTGTPGSTATTTFTLSDTNDSGLSATDSNTSVTATFDVVATAPSVPSSPPASTGGGLGGSGGAATTPLDPAPLAPAQVQPDPILAITPTPTQVQPDPIVAITPTPAQVQPAPIVAPTPTQQGVSGFDGVVSDGLAYDAGNVGGARGALMGEVSSAIAAAISDGGDFPTMIQDAAQNVMANSSRPMRALAYLGGLVQGSMTGSGNGLFAAVNDMFGGGVVTNRTMRSIAVAGFQEGLAMNQGNDPGSATLAAAISAPSSMAATSTTAAVATDTTSPVLATTAWHHS